MSKYDPLTAFLKSKGGREIRMSFAEIEQVIGHKLPSKSKAIRAWWSNNPNNNVLTRAWLAAGYKSAQVDIAAETLSFVPNGERQGLEETKQAKFAPAIGSDSEGALPKGKTPYRHPAWGAMKGMIRLLPDVDLTAPAYEDWKRLYGEEK